MNPSIARHCPQCKQYQTIEIKENSPLSCPNCAQNWGTTKELKDVFEFCPVCQCRQFYTSKDFNQFIGCFIMLIGIVLVPWTYGISLPIFALIDWLLSRQVPTIINCYKCGTEFRGFPLPQRLKSFMHHIGLKYDKYR